MLPQAPVRARTISPVTPLVADVIFTELVDCNRRELPAYGTPHPDTNKWPNHKLGLIKPFADGKREEIYTFYYVADREQQDLYNWEYAQANIGEQKFDAITRTYVIPRSEFSEEESFELTDSALIDRQIKRSGDPEIDSLYVIVQNTYAALSTLVRYDYDSEFGCFLRTSQTLIAGNAPPAGSGPAGNIVTEYQQLTSRWYVQIEREIVCESLMDGITYNVTVDYQFPAVLSDVTRQVWNRRDGGAEIYFVPIFSRNAYRGECEGRVHEQWFSSPQTVPLSSVFNPQPLPIDINSPFFSLSIPACLHGSVDIEWVTGTSDPTYEPTFATYTFGATNPSTLNSGDEVLAKVDQKRLRGGFLVTQVYVTIP